MSLAALQGEYTKMRFALMLLIRFAIGTVVIIGMLAFQGMHSIEVHAASECSAATCTGKDPTAWVGPHNIYCNKNAYLQEHKDYSFGWIENWWSQECDANWTIVNVNSGYFIGEAEATACSSGAGFTSSGGWTCNAGAATRVCDYLPTGWSVCGALDPYNTGDIPGGTTHWYTNMVRGDVSTISVAGVECVGGCVTLTMQTGWH